MAPRGVRRGDSSSAESRRDRRGETSDSSGDEWVLEETSEDVERGNARGGSGASTSQSSEDLNSSSSTMNSHKRSRGWHALSRGNPSASKAELTPILKPSRFQGGRSDLEGATDGSLDSSDDEEYSGVVTTHRHKMRARVVLGATLVLGAACAAAATLTTATSNHVEIANFLKTFPTKFSSDKQTLALSGERRWQSAFHGRTVQTARGDQDEHSNSRRSQSSPPTAARAGLVIPPKAKATLGRFQGESESELDDTSLTGLDDLFFPALGDAQGNARDDTAQSKQSPTTNSPPPKYLIGLTTSAGFGDQFKRVSTYAAMARELNRTLVVWPVFTSPHYDLGQSASGEGNGGPLLFDKYVRLKGEGATDNDARLISWGDEKLPERVRNFPIDFPNACVTSNNQPNDVQFLTSADLNKAVIAPTGVHSSYEEQVRELRKREGQVGKQSGKNSAETLCVASTFSDSDYNKDKHGETRLAWKSLDFRPVGKFHHWWAHAVDSMVLSRGLGVKTSVWAISQESTLQSKSDALRTLDTALDGENSGQGIVAVRAMVLEKWEGSDREDSSPDSSPDSKTPKPFTPTPTTFKVTPKYTALHWRRGDKCGQKSERQKSKKNAQHEFDAKKTGAYDALLCDYESYKNAAVLDLCVPLAPMYVATDDQNPEFLQHLKSKGCLVREDLFISKASAALGSDQSITPETPMTSLDDVDALVLDVMLVAGAEVSFTFGHTALARLYDRMRMSRHSPRSINVAADAAAFRKAYAAATAGLGSSAAAAAALGDNADELATE